MSVRLQNFTTQELQWILDRAKSWKRFKDILGIDDKQLQALLSHNRSITLDKLALWCKFQIEGELKRLGSTELFCIIHRCKESELRSRAKQLDVDIKLHTTPMGSTIGIGRKGELAVKEVRGQMISEDCFETKGHSAPYDLFDIVYGRLNVKTACIGRHKARSRRSNPTYWHFSTKGWENCDYLVFVPLDSAGNPLKVIFAKSSVVAEKCPDHVTLTGADIKGSSKRITSMQNNFNDLESRREYLLVDFDGLDCLQRRKAKKMAVEAAENEQCSPVRSSE